MKNITKIFAIALVALGFSSISYGQTSSASANSEATIITPISISKQASNGDLNFGNIIADSDGGSVTVSPAGARSATGLTLPAATPGTISTAKFTVTGLANATYFIALPASSFNVTGPGTAMAVGTFLSNPAAGATGLLTGGTQDIEVGATLTVGANQTAGVYSNTGGLTVTVNYN